MIKLMNCSKSYGDRLILDDVSFEASTGKSYAIIGESGSGKSTMLNILGTLDKEYSGELIINDCNIKKESDKIVSNIRNQLIGFVFQAYHLLDNYTVKENLLIPLLYSSNKVSDYEDLIKERLSRLQVLDFLNKKVNELSGGEKQRVAIARALVNNPSIIIADEPTGNLDWDNTKILMDIFNKIRDSNVAVIIVTHDLRVAEFCDEIHEIKNKKLLRIDKKQISA